MESWNLKSSHVQAWGFWVLLRQRLHCCSGGNNAWALGFALRMGGGWACKAVCGGTCPRIWRRKWQPTPVFLSGKPRGQRSLAGYSPWGHKRVRHDLVTKPLVPPSQVKCLTDQGGRMVFGSEHGHGICQKLRVGTWLAPYGCGSSKVSMCQSFFFCNCLSLWHWDFIAAHGLSLVVVSRGYS